MLAERIWIVVRLGVVCRVEGTSVWMWMRNGMIVVRESRRQHRKLDQGWTNGRDSNGARHGSNILVGKIGIFKAVLSKRFSITMFLFFYLDAHVN
jgi:hypothetical protein